jgi:hypothetical protein
MPEKIVKIASATRRAFFRPKKSLSRAKTIRKPVYVRRYETTIHPDMLNWPKLEEIFTSVVATIVVSRVESSKANNKLFHTDDINFANG